METEKVVTHLDVDVHASEEKVASPAQRRVKKFTDDDGVMRVSTKQQNLRARLGWLIQRLANDQPVTLLAYGSAIGTAIWMSSVVRNKVGDVHQVSSLLEHTFKDDGRETHGVKIVLSKATLDETAPGYQLPEAKGFWVQPRRQKVSAEKQKSTERKVVKTEETAEAQPAKKKQAKYRKKLIESAVNSEAKAEEQKNSRVDEKTDVDADARPKRQKRKRSSRKAPEEKAEDVKAAAEPVEAAPGKQTDDKKSQSKSRSKGRPKSKSQAGKSSERQEKPEQVVVEKKESQEKENRSANRRRQKSTKSTDRNEKEPQKAAQEKSTHQEVEEESKSQPRKAEKEPNEEFYDGGYAQRKRSDNQGYQSRGAYPYPKGNRGYGNRGGSYYGGRSDYQQQYYRSPYYGGGGGYWMYDGGMYEGRSYGNRQQRQGQYKGSREIGTSGRPLESTSHGGSGREATDDQFYDKEYQQKRQLPTRSSQKEQSGER